MIQVAVWIWLASVILCGIVAREKKRLTIAWVIAGIFFGPLALLAISGLPTAR